MNKKVSFTKISRKNIFGYFFFISILIIIPFGTFFLTKGNLQNLSELQYVEYSILGKSAGSLVPASCDSATPFSSPTSAGGTAGSHFNGDCVTTCPNGYGTYDPYYNPSAVGCCTNGATNPSACSVCPGGQVFSGGVCSTQVWTSYCTGGSDPYGNNWQVWQYDNGDSRAYRNTGAICNPTPSISTSPTHINWNTGSAVTWSSNNTSGCFAGGSWGGGKSVSGSQGTGNLTSSQTYNIYCTNNYGQSSGWVSASVTVGSFAAPTWTGSSFVTPIGTITDNSCTIATGASSCSMNVAWSTTNPPGLVEVRRPYAGNSVMATGASGNGSYVFPYQASAYTLDLYDAHRNVKLDDGLFTATCALGGWDSMGGVCANPLVTNVTVTGQYYSTPGTLSFTCSGSNNYTVRNTDLGTTVASGVYSGATSVGVTPSANYSVTCSHGNYSSNPTVRYYNAPPPPPAIVSIVASPRTISKDAKTTLTWDVQWPPISPAVCTISAKSICTNGICNAAQLASEVALNNKLNTENTDTTDTSGSRRITTAVTTVAPGHIDTDWKALGKKTFSIPNTTEFTIDCGNGRKASTRVQVTTSNER